MCSTEWARKIVTDMADEDFIYRMEQENHQRFLLQSTVEDLANYITNSTDAYYRAIER